MDMGKNYHAPDSEIGYSCKTCGSNKTAGVRVPAPYCCGKPMQREKLPQCTIAQHAEMARTVYDDEPCDDNRAYE
jgi:hypothetical protein